MAYGSALFKELEAALSSVDLSDTLTKGIESTRRGEADSAELFEEVQNAFPEISLLTDTRITEDLFEVYLDMHYNIIGDYVEYYAYWVPEDGIHKRD